MASAAEARGESEPVNNRHRVLNIFFMKFLLVKWRDKMNTLDSVSGHHRQDKRDGIALVSLRSG